MADLILRGPPCRDPRIDMGMGEYFLGQADKMKDKVFQIDGDTGKKETYQDVKRRSIRVALYLKKIGVKPKDIVLLCCKNNLDNIVPILAAHYLGAIVASVDPIQSVSDVKHSLKLTEPKTIVVEKDSVDLIEKSLEDMDLKPYTIAIGDETGKYPNMLDIEKDAQEEREFITVNVKGSDIAVILFSSGTTSLPKGVYMTHGAMLNNSTAVLQHNLVKPGVMLHLASMYWISSWILTVICVVTGTAKLVAPTITAEKCLENVDRHKVTHLFCTSSFTYQITSLDKSWIQKYDTSSLYSVVVGGAPIDPAQIHRLRDYLPHTFVNLAYGSSEANYMVTHNYSNPQPAKEKITSSGIPLPGLQLKFIDVDTENLLGPNQKGEIRAKSENMMAGYHKYTKPDAFDEDGFFKVGDCGYYDEDGYVYVTDRLNEMFKFHNWHVSPTVLETVLLQHPSVAEAVVFGIPHAVDQNHPAACVALKSGSKTTPEELVDFVGSQVADYQRLRGGLVILESIPKTPSGKVQKRVVKENFMKVRNQGN